MAPPSTPSAPVANASRLEVADAVTAAEMEIYPDFPMATGTGGCGPLAFLRSEEAMTDDGPKMVAAFEYIRETYRTVSRMLQSADAIMADRGLAPHSGWHSIWPHRSATVASADQWIPAFVLRQYFSSGMQESEVVTLGCVLFSLDDRRLSEPICIGSHLFATEFPNDIYRWALTQRWALASHPTDGVPRFLRSADIRFVADDERAGFEKVVVGGVLATVAVPLLTITSTADLERCIIDPILGQGFTIEKTRADAMG